MGRWAFISTDGSKPSLRELLESPKIAFDVEGTGTDLGSDVPVGISLACKPTNGYYAPIEDQFSRSLLAMDKLYIAHNASYDRSMAKKAGVIVNNLADTMIAAHLLEKKSLALKNLTKIGVTSFEELKNGFAGMSINDMCNYSGPHAMAAYELWNDYEKKLEELSLSKLFWTISMPLVPVISDMELNGVMVDKNKLNEVGELIEGMLDVLKEALDSWSGMSNVNYNSPDQLAHILYDVLGLPKHPWMRTSRNRPTTDAKYLQTLKHHPFVALYLQYKQLMTLRNSYVRSLSKLIHSDGRVYCKFNQTGTRTGRLSSSDPNLQKIPVRTELGRRIREAFIAPEGYKLLNPDYDQLELRVLAICSRNPYLLDAFRNGRDIHAETAVRAFGDVKFRQKAKTLNFKIVYGGGDTAARDSFFKAYPGIDTWMSKIFSEAREARYIRTLNGRIRTIEEYMFSNMLGDKNIEHGDREAMSTLVQGTSAEEVQAGMIELWKSIRDSEVKMNLQVHDELLIEVPERILMDVAKLVKEKLTIHKYEIPLTVSIKVGDNWGNMTKLEV